MVRWWAQAVNALHIAMSIEVILAPSMRCKNTRQRPSAGQQQPLWCRQCWSVSTTANTNSGGPARGVGMCACTFMYVLRCVVQCSVGFERKRGW